VGTYKLKYGSKLEQANLQRMVVLVLVVVVVVVAEEQTNTKINS
jgi:hypothetical protein